MICLYCGGDFIEPFSLHKMFFKERETACSQCLAQFERIKDPACEICCGTILENQKLCQNCKEYIKLNPNQPIIVNKSIFQYTNEMKEWLNRYKFYGDVTLASLFITDLKEYYQKSFRNFKIVPIPLSKERLKERGFNQVEILAQQAGLPFIKCLQRVHTEKQSKLSRYERLSREQVFSFCGDEKFKNVPILILDDVYTTGKTVRDAAIILLQNGATEVYSLTLIRA
ncbi:ComF family protein [Gottfriedia luciferensis]|uniref:ComF family protein n=1 Tax=Gottfriedia luciferensis TaxID=178774 RepID=UPI001155022C|nr:ComF family protein [Gottfriedia luciferensis]